MVQTFSTFAEALEHRTDETSVCGTYRDDECQEPIYFLAPADADADEMRRISFEVKYGRPLGGYEQWLLEQAKRVRL